MMKDTKNITIALLCVTATLLLTVILLVSDTEEAVAATSESRTSKYIMVPGRATSTRDVVYVIDMNTEKLNAYLVDRDWQVRDIELAAGPIDLAKLMRQAEARRGPGR